MKEETYDAGTWPDEGNIESDIMESITDLDNAPREAGQTLRKLQAREADIGRMIEQGYSDAAVCNRYNAIVAELKALQGASETKGSAPAQADAQTAAHTPGPWKVMADPINAGKHPYHDNRWIATIDTEIEFGHDPRSWALSSGSLICEMRDIDPANARLIAAAPSTAARLARVERERGQLAISVPSLNADVARISVERDEAIEREAAMDRLHTARMADFVEVEAQRDALLAMLRRIFESEYGFADSVWPTCEEMRAAIDSVEGRAE